VRQLQYHWPKAVTTSRGAHGSESATGCFWASRAALDLGLCCDFVVGLSFGQTKGALPPSSWCQLP